MFVLCFLLVAIRQALSKSLVAYYQKYVDEASKKEIKVGINALSILHRFF